MSAHVILNLLNELRKRYKMRGLSSTLSLFCNEFNKFNKTGARMFVCLFCCFTSQVNRYGHGRMVSSPSHTFFMDKLEQAVNQYFVHILSLQTDNSPS